MPADPSMEGQTGAPFKMAVETGKVKEFARACKSTNPAYDGGPHDQITMHPTFLQASAFWQTPESSPMRGASLDLRRILHGGQEFVFHGPPPKSGQVLTGTSRVDKVYSKEGKRGGTMSFVETVTEYRNEAGDVVAETRSTLIETSQAAS